MADDSFDVVVLGGGNAGYAAAFRASGLGMSVALVESDKVGGTCLHRGCIPTKALLHAADLMDEFRNASAFGLSVSEPKYDWSKVLAFKESVVDSMYKGLSALVKKNKVELVQGMGRITDERTVAVETSDGNRSITADKGLVIASGSYARELPFIKADGDKVYNSTHGLTAEDVPDSIIVVGGNYIGLEFASVYRSFGADVQVVEMLDKIAPNEDSDISKSLAKLLEERGIKFHVGVEVTGASSSDSGVEVELKKGDGSETLTADRLLVAVGRGPRTEDIGLEDAGIKTEGGFIVTDEMFQTSAGDVFAIGDAIQIPDANWPHPQLAHVAFLEGTKVAEQIAGEDVVPIDYKNIPHIIYCQPEVASVGLTEDKAKELGMDVVSKRYMFTHNARALMLGGGEGFVKTVAEKNGAVIGVHIIGPRASDMITEAQLVTSWEAYPSELAELTHAHPTLSEVIGETFLGLAGKPLHGT